MDDARDAIMSFYDPLHIEKKSSAKPPPVLKKVRFSGGGWRRRRTYSMRKKFTRKPTLVKKKRVSLNKFTEAMEDIERALANAQLIGRVQHNQDRLRKLLKLIKTAVSKRSYRFARKAIGEAMYTIKKLQDTR